MGENQLIAQLSFEERMELHEELYGAAVDHMQQAETDRPQDTEDSRRHVARAADLFERAVMLFPENWNALWALGMASQRLGEVERAYEAFREAYELEPNNVQVCIELCHACIVLGKGAEAVTVAQRACALDPDAPDLVANLALAYLIDHQIAAAVDTVLDASRRDPDDPITGQLRVLIEAVARHEIEAPTRWPP